MHCDIGHCEIDWTVSHKLAIALIPRLIKGVTKEKKNEKKNVRMLTKSVKPVCTTSS